MATRKEASGRGKIHVPTPEQRKKVEMMSAVGIPQKAIALVLNIHHETLMKHYRMELDTAATKANAQIGGKLYEKCLAGDTSSIIFWLKTRAQWKETAVHEHTGKDGRPIQFEELTNEEDIDARLSELLRKAGIAGAIGSKADSEDQE